MGGKTGISWTDSTWNPIRGCTRVSPGCVNCYAETMASRFAGPGQPYEGTVREGRWNGEIRLVPEHLADPLRWKRPRRVFVNSMSDLFHDGVPDEYVAATFAVMAASRDHTFQILTKRVDRARRWFGWWRSSSWVVDDAMPLFTGESDANLNRVRAIAPDLDRARHGGYPIPNVHLGASVEDARRADRVVGLVEVPAAVRFLSIEPLLGPVEIGLAGILPSSITGTAYVPVSDAIGWVIVGGESGLGARPCRVRWILDLVAECRGSRVPVFVKQIGSNAVGLDGRRLDLRDSKGGDLDENRAIHPDLAIREFPEPA